MSFDNELPAGVALTSLDKFMGLNRKASVWRFDISRFGMEVFRASPRHADLMIVSGRVSWKMAPIIRNAYDAMPEPKWVISMGACASSGGVFNNYAVVQGCDHVVPVDVYLPGCPPRPEALIHAIMVLWDQIHYRTPITQKERLEIARKAEKAALEATPTSQMKGLLA